MRFSWVELITKKHKYIGIFKWLHQAFNMIGKMFPMLSGKYMLTYCIKEVIKGNIFWWLNKKVPAYEAATVWNRGIPCIFFQNTDSIVFVFFIFLFLNFCIKESIKGNFLDIKFKSVGLWGSYGLKQGNPLQFFKTLIQLYLPSLFLYFWLTVSKRVSKAIFLDNKFKIFGLLGSYGLKQGNPLQNINISNQIIFGST